MPTPSSQVIIAHAELESATSTCNCQENNDISLSPVQRQPPPMDYGKDAWLFLAACFCMEALLWGFASTFGVFQSYYSLHVPFNNSRNTAVIGTCAVVSKATFPLSTFLNVVSIIILTVWLPNCKGIMYLGAPIFFTMCKYYPEYQRIGCITGLLGVCLALGFASLAKNVTQLIISQGVLYGMSGCIAYSPCIILVDDWFTDKRKGFAYGVMWAGSGVGGAVLPIVTEQLLEHFGFRMTLRIFASSLLLLIAPLVYFLKRRVAISESPRPPPLNLAFLMTPAFALFEICNIIEALGYFLPSIYLPSYARSIGASSGLDVLTVILFNVATVVGCVVMGYLIDRYDATHCILLSTVGSSLGVFLLWGFSISLPPLFMFSIVYGLFAGSYTSTWTGVTRDIINEKNSAEPSIVLACLAAGRGMGNVASGPITGSLLHDRNGNAYPYVYAYSRDGYYAYGGRYGALIIFTGITGFLGGGSYLARRLKWL